MPRYFQNISPFGDLVTLGRTVAKGDVLTAYDEGIAIGLAEQPLNWLEVDADGNPLGQPEPVEIPGEVSATDGPLGEAANASTGEVTAPGDPLPTVEQPDGEPLAPAVEPAIDPEPDPKPAKK